MKVFKASLDSFSKISSLAILGLIIFLIFQNIKTNSLFSLTVFPVSAIGFYISSLLLIFVLLFRPMNYSIEESQIKINRPIYPFIINRSEIVKCSLVSKDEMSGVFRTFGNGGLLGYTGFYRNTKFGTMRWFATQRKNYVLIEKTNGKKIVITPDEPENFIDGLN